MSYLQKQMELLKFDQRLVNINLKRGILKKEEWEAHKQSIPDSEKNAANMDLEAETDEDQYDAGPSASEGASGEEL